MKNKGLNKKDLHLVNDLHAAMQQEEHKGMYWTIILLVSLAIAALVWSYNATLEEVSRGQGSIIPSSREQVIQSLDPGTLSEMLVKEGDLVEQGQVLLKLDNTRSVATLRESQAKIDNLRAVIVRLSAQAYGKRLIFPKDIPAEYVERETLAYKSKQRSLSQSIASLESNKALLDEEIKIIAPLVDKGAYSETEFLSKKREAGKLQLEIVDRRNRYKTEASNELVKVEAELAQIQENIKRSEDVVAHSELKSPLKGIVKNIRINTIGGVISAGQDIMEIVPVDETLLVEAYISPRDIAYVRPGMKAIVKITAYDYALYGGLDGEVTLLSSGALRDTKRPSELNLNPNDAFYRVIVRTNDSKMTDKNGKELPIIPGMIASVDIKTGEKTVFQYLTKPLTRMKQALSER